MPSLIVSQCGAAGAVLLAAWALESLTRAPEEDVYGLCWHPDTHLERFWRGRSRSRSTVEKLLARDYKGLPLVRFRVAAGGQILGEVAGQGVVPHFDRLALVRMDADHANPVSSFERVVELSKVYQELLVWADIDSHWPELLASRSHQGTVHIGFAGTHLERLPAIMPSPRCTHLLALAGAALYEVPDTELQDQAIRLGTALKQHRHTGVGVL